MENVFNSLEMFWNVGTKSNQILSRAVPSSGFALECRLFLRKFLTFPRNCFSIKQKLLPVNIKYRWMIKLRTIESFVLNLERIFEIPFYSKDSCFIYLFKFNLILTAIVCSDVVLQSKVVCSADIKWKLHQFLSIFNELILWMKIDLSTLVTINI